MEKSDKIKSENKPFERVLADIDEIKNLPKKYSNDFVKFCQKNEIKIPNINSNIGIALSLMLNYKSFYWNRETCNQIFNKFNIKTNDSIQSFNKINQLGIKTSSGIEKGKYYIFYPYCVSNKYKMRRNFKYNGTKEEKNKEIDNIKSFIKENYIEVLNDSWQLGHKNPGLTDNTKNNLVLQPPIQSKYRDNYIFINSLEKYPTPKKLENLIIKKEIEFSKEQLESYIEIFQKQLKILDDKEK